MTEHIPQPALAFDRRAKSTGNMIRGLPHPVPTPAPSRTAQKRDIDTHRLVKLRTGSVTDRGPHQGKAAKGGLCERHRGKRLATDKRHRADTDQEAKGLPLHVGGKERGSAKRERTMSVMLTYVIEELRG